MLDFIALLVAMALPWALGVATLAAMNRGKAASAAWMVGCGWFIGMFALTVWMRAVSLAGMRMSLMNIGVPIAAATLIALWVARQRDRAQWGEALRAAFRRFAGADLAGLRRTLWRLIIAWLALRFGLLFAEVWWQPLFPWDAWTQWSTKARVWYELRTMAPFVDIGTWLTAPGAGYVDHGPHYPATVPLLQVWSALAIGRWDDALVNVPWWFTGVAFAFALHGALRQLSFSPLVALTGSALVMTLPILNVHVALAGYADLHMAAYFTLGALASLHAVKTRKAQDIAVAVALLAACVTIKNPGKAWLIVVLPGLLVAALPRVGLKVVGVLFAAFAIGILVLVRTGMRILGYQLLPEFMMPWNALFDAYFSFANWNLLWYFALTSAVLGARQLLSRDVAPLSCIVAAGLMFLFVGFAFTNAFLWVEDQSTVNRATLHLAPLVVVWMLVTLRAWRERGSQPVPTPRFA